jgi:cyclomaltodextrinase / maltogenic alpha-amylase / neopullulanase
MINFKNKFGITNFLLIISFLFFIPQTFSQVTTSVKHPAWSYNQSIYEVNTRQYSKEGTFKAVEKDIPRLKKLGVGIVWLMPVHPIGIINRKGTLGSYYSVRDYLAVDSSYGTIADLNSLVKTVHSNGMYLIIDWVANHTSWDNKLAKEHPEFYTKDSLGNFVPPVPDWKDVIDLNYDNKALRTYMINAMKFWIKKCDIDGFRCDVADMVPTDFWVDARKELDKVKPVFMLAEAEKPALHEKCFDMSYSWELFNIIKKIAVSENNPSKLRIFFNKEAMNFPPDAFRMRFTENHDENSWNGSAIEKLGKSAEMFAVFSGVIPGMPLVYNGQEACNNKRLDFFEKDPLQWKDCNLKNVYTKLLNLKKSNKSLLNGDHGGKLLEVKSDKDTTVYAFTRENGKNKIFAVFNMSNKTVDVSLKGKELFGTYKELFTDDKAEFKDSADMRLEPWGYKVFVK